MRWKLPWPSEGGEHTGSGRYSRTGRPAARGTSPRATGVGALSRALDALVDAAGRVHGVRRSDLGLGDWVMIRTKNSSYSIRALGDGRYRVSGGWFDARGMSPAVVTINGCTWGGSAIQTDLLAGRGLFLEFGNRVVTTRIRDVRLVRSRGLESCN